MQHACQQCGHDLSRIRALPDPHYALPVVTCPACATSVVRRRDPVIDAWRRARRTARALVVTACQFVFFITTTAAATGLVTNAAHQAHSTHRGNPLGVLVFRPDELHPDRFGPVLAMLIASLFMLGVLVGAWIRSGLAHLPPVRAWLGCCAVVALIANLPAVAYRLGPTPGPGVRAWGDPAAWERLTHTLTAAAVYAAAVPLGFPLGRTVRAAWRAHRASRRSRLRRGRSRLREDR